MTSRAQEWASFTGAESESLGIGRLTWMGLFIAAIGWTLLIGEATLTDVIVAKTMRPVTPTFHNDVCNIAMCLIGSGFGLAIIGGLQTGFGTLNRFFGAVLTRSNQRAAPPAPAHVAPTHVAPTHVAPREVTPVAQRRPYRTLADGSVEVETILGTRRFATMADARDFI